MATYDATIHVPIPISVVFNYLADFSTTEQWDPDVTEAQMLTPAPIGLGSQFRVVAAFAGRRVPLTYEIIEFERPYSLTVRAEHGSIVSQDTITFAPAATAAAFPPVEGLVSADAGATHAAPAGETHSPVARTTIDYHAELVLSGPARLLEPVVSARFDRIGHRAAAGLRAALLDREDP